MRRRLLHLQGVAIIGRRLRLLKRSGANLPFQKALGLLLLTAARADITSPGDVALDERLEDSPVPPPSSHPFGPGPSSVDKGKAPLVEEAEEEEEGEEEEGEEGGDLSLQRK
ncbi:hypothetical protein Pyn_04911 [Prunus yedoensis var. nudiflora]|uniref:Uncharacterized protein n=1 Tax=Prunus yedoensis var. nudiflora TaxID=2094558 RepID=A0A314YME2_PRUYE|nr:hypothetical protein Pyn_04911 [Prunus yedoensis var. nudiflora]